MSWLSFLIYMKCISHILAYTCSDHHHTIVKGVNLFEQFVPYKSHPYAKSANINTTDILRHNSSQTQSLQRRSLLSANEVSPIRISAYYDTNTINKLPSNERKYIRELIGAVADYYRQTVSVIPVNGALYFNRQCSKGSVTTWGTACTSYLQPKCHGMNIPADHLSEQYQYNSDGTVTVLPRGRGIIDSDLVLYVSSNDNTVSCQATALAHAGPCTYDQYGRPISGNINLCSKFFNNNDWKQDVGIILHEITHITIMLKSLWDAFKDYKGSTIPIYKVYDDSESKLISPKVRQTAREHFNCNQLSGLQVQPTSPSHWHERYLFSEVMTATTFSEQEYFSEFTLALLDDSGWYVVNYENAEPFHFGRNAGCNFFNGDCINKRTHKSNFPHFYCDSHLDDGCNADYSAPSTCYYLTNLDDIPSKYKYFNDDHHGGFVNMNYCPSRSSYVDQTTCWDTIGDGSIYEGETWGITSRCADIHRTDGGSDKGYCFEHTCGGWNGRQWEQVDIKFSDKESINCKRSDKLKRKTLNSVSNRQITCPDIDIVCGTNSQFGRCFWGHYSDSIGTCICSPGYKGSSCRWKNKVQVASVRIPPAKLPTPAPTLNPSQICFQDWNEYDVNFNGIWLQDDTFFELKAYKKTLFSGISRQLFWNGIHASWWISYERSSSAGVYCYCSVSLYTPNIGDCSSNWKCYLNNGWKIIPNAKTYYGHCQNVTPTATAVISSIQSITSPSPTPSLTPSPTPAPSLTPTNYPSRTPTNTPTFNPSTNSTRTPTGNPTQLPTSNPTITPSKYPTVNPTNSPTINPSRKPTLIPTNSPTLNPSTNPSITPTSNPTINPSRYPTVIPTNSPTFDPSKNPSITPTSNPTKTPTLQPTKTPTSNPSNGPTQLPSKMPTVNPTTAPNKQPTMSPTKTPTNVPTVHPTNNPTTAPINQPTLSPTKTPTNGPTVSPTTAPTIYPTITPTENPTKIPSQHPTETPSNVPTEVPSKEPTNTPSKVPTETPSRDPTITPTQNPTVTPSFMPTLTPIINDTRAPSNQPTISPTQNPTKIPNKTPTETPTEAPTEIPTTKPTIPTNQPAVSPTLVPTKNPTNIPTHNPSLKPTSNPSPRPTRSPSNAPTDKTSLSNTNDIGSQNKQNQIAQNIVVDFSPYIYTVFIGICILNTVIFTLCIFIKKKSQLFTTTLPNTGDKVE